MHLTANAEIKLTTLRAVRAGSRQLRPDIADRSVR
jgi:hypothetical protein